MVSFALAGLDEQAQPPAKSVTLLQGAYLRIAFGHSLRLGGNGALDGKFGRIDGPLTVCFSSLGRALSLLYPLASTAAGIRPRLYGRSGPVPAPEPVTVSAANCSATRSHGWAGVAGGFETHRRDSPDAKRCSFCCSHPVLVRLLG